MKKATLLSLLFLTCVFCINAQNIFQATLKLGSGPNKVKAVIRPNTDVTNSISNWQFTFAVPKTITPMPTVAVSNNPYATGVTYNILTNQDANFYYYTLDGSGVASSPPVFSFTNGTEYDAVEITFSIAVSPAPTSTVRLIQIPAGTFSGVFYTNLYLEFAGADLTNQTAQFYGAGSSNDGAGYSGTSFVTLNNVLLPTKFVSFVVAKEKDDARLTWTVDNEENNDHFEIERSLDGRTFTRFATVSALKNGHSSNSYQLTDGGLSRQSSKQVYYRVKQVEYSGASALSAIRNVKLDQLDFKLALYPNPAISRSTLMFYAEQAGKGSIVVRDIQGREISVMNQAWVKGMNQQTIDVTGFAAGEYNISIVGDNINQTVKLRKVN